MKIISYLTENISISFEKGILLKLDKMIKIKYSIILVDL